MWITTVFCLQAVVLSGVFAQINSNVGASQFAQNKQQNGNTSPKVYTLPEEKTYFAKQIGTFSLNLLKAVSRNPDINTVLSPFSVATLLSLLQQAAAQSTEEQITTALGLKPENSRIGFRNAIDSLTYLKSKSSFENANAIFVKSNINLNTKFKSIANEIFNAQVLPIDFKDSKETSDIINQWVSEATHGKIRDLISAGGNYEALQMVLINALYFKGVWQSKFTPNRTTTRPFSLQSGYDVPAEFMYQSEKHNVGEDITLGARWIEKHFDGDEFSMLFIMPTERHNLEGLLQRMTGADIHRMLTIRNVKNAVVQIPRFKLSTAASLIEPLKALGVNDIFNYNAHLEAMLDPPGSLVVSDVVHRAEITVDEEGTRAAAASAVVVNTLSLGSYYDDFRFEANQPFLAIIVDKTNYLPVFMSRINNPTI